MTLTITNIITFISIYPIVIILYYFQRSTVKSHARRAVCSAEFGAYTPLPIKLSLQEKALVAEHTDTEFTVPLEDIVNLTIIEELPRLRKVTGSGLPNLNAGTSLVPIHHSKLPYPALHGSAINKSLDNAFAL